ncbi:MAG: thiazole synthase, partial [Chloroflexi bacterium]|nr:thiazole synthase [Chloroflexota bacterium]
DWVKLEVIPDSKYLLPDSTGTLEAAKILVEEGFVVLPYINDDPVLAKQLQEIGTATVMPLASPIGSGQGMVNFEQIRIIIEQATVPVIVDAGIGAPSDAALAMEMGADACLVNTAVALAGNPPLMAQAMAQAVEAGRKAFLAGRIPKKAYASASSPLEGVVR